MKCLFNLFIGEIMIRRLSVALLFGAVAATSFAAQVDPGQCYLKCVKAGADGNDCRYICYGI